MLPIDKARASRSVPLRRTQRPTCIDRRRRRRRHRRDRGTAGPGRPVAQGEHLLQRQRRGATAGSSGSAGRLQAAAHGPRVLRRLFREQLEIAHAGVHDTLQ